MRVCAHLGFLNTIMYTCRLLDCFSLFCDFFNIDFFKEDLQLTLEPSRYEVSKLTFLLLELLVVDFRINLSLMWMLWGRTTLIPYSLYFEMLWIFFFIYWPSFGYGSLALPSFSLVAEFKDSFYLLWMNLVLACFLSDWFSLNYWAFFINILSLINYYW
jgi:hypothetical protein